MLRLSGVALVAESPAQKTSEPRPVLRNLAAVYRSGRRLDAELVRSRLEADGIDARIWSSGLGAGTTQSALTEMTGVPNDFNYHQVVVDPADVARSLEALAQPTPDAELEEGPVSGEGVGTFLESLRKRWMLLTSPSSCCCWSSW